MADKILLTYVILDILFVGSGALLLGFALTTKTGTSQAPTIASVATDLLLMGTPLNAAIGNAILIFFAFLISIPAMLLSTTRGWLKLHGFFVVVCGLFTLVIGLDIWFGTLESKQSLLDTWIAQSATTQSLLQEQLSCCGYFNSTSAPAFVIDSTCPNAIIAATMPGCSAAFVKLDGLFLDVIFTAAFGIVGLDVALIFGIAMLNKDRKERERYRFIDEKNGTGSF
ncbi:Bcpls1 [Botrytis cinerea B05.10]|uniref:Bcpls1 n=3 Tax=Botryotinia fuckeliana TaxID=40559 RepID=A0A384JTK7_BOTFB|nr:Bcpls1 [Botrytis cinerea B05.10]ATZ53842.1 Bcpls1 [Botrytis cinerea B05.10]EMR90826.1 putative tetraspanin protein [Botrytis cinerea BcDW1]CAD43406.1 tetraspanin [Botrytis cinerea]